MVKYKFNTLEDFLISHKLTVDTVLDDGWGAYFPVKGIELEATILFADISGFSLRTLNLSPVETLIFVNNFFSWITAEAIKNRPCIVDKYIGDEVMLLFSKEFGSDDPFLDALQTARFMVERDALSYQPHIGIANGKVIAGYVGTPIKYNASLFGKPVTFAARCASVKPKQMFSSSITFMAESWHYSNNIDEIYPPLEYTSPDGRKIKKDQTWELLAPYDVEFKNIGKVKVRSIINKAFWAPMMSAEERAKKWLDILKKNKMYNPK